MAEFFHMGGYGFYVWWSYAAFAAGLVWLIAAPMLARRSALRRIARDADRARRRSPS